MRYKLYLHNNDILIYKCIIWTNDIMEIANHYGTPLIEKGLRNGVNLWQQINILNLFMKGIYKQKINCYKIRKTDLDMYLASYCALLKLNRIENPHNDLIILKIKKK